MLPLSTLGVFLSFGHEYLPRADAINHACERCGRHGGRIAKLDRGLHIPWAEDTCFFDKPAVGVENEERSMEDVWGHICPMKRGRRDSIAHIAGMDSGSSWYCANQSSCIHHFRVCLICNVRFTQILSITPSKRVLGMSG